MQVNTLPFLFIKTKLQKETPKNIYKADAWGHRRVIISIYIEFRSYVLSFDPTRVQPMSSSLTISIYINNTWNKLLDETCRLCFFWFCSMSLLWQTTRLKVRSYPLSNCSWNVYIFHYLNLLQSKKESLLSY